MSFRHRNRQTDHKQKLCDTPKNHNVSATLWYVYLLSCADGTLYCGITTNITRRLAQHNGQCAGGARYTRGRRPVSLLASKACALREQALRLEQAVKSRPKNQKIDFLLSGEI